MVITVEPGCYFNPFLLNPAFKNPAQAKYLNKSSIQTYMVSALVPAYLANRGKEQAHAKMLNKATDSQDFGGIRIEDDVILTATGCETMTDVPRTVDDIEQVMAGKSWP